jgi:hypothetical protein
MTTTVFVVLLVVAAVALAGAVALDRSFATRAERTAAQYLSAPLGHPATVHVHGRPFLTQAVRGRYRDVELLGSLRFGAIDEAPLVAHLTNVYLSLGELLRRRVRELPCEHIEGRLVLTYRDLAQAAGIPGLELWFEGERLLASAVLPVPGMSQLVRLTGEGRFSPTGSGSAWLRIGGVSVAGIGVPQLVLSQLLPRLSVPVPLPQLPYGLRLDAVRPTASGLVVDASAAATVLRPGGRPDS